MTTTETKTNPKCTRCRCYWVPQELDYKTSGLLCKSCPKCRARGKAERERNKCEHGNQRYRCKVCKGVSICEHNRIRSACKQCKGVSICVHSRIRNACKDCGGSQICIHKRIRSQCVVCNPLGNLRKRMFDRFHGHFAQSDYTPEQDYLFYLGCTVQELYEKLKDKIHSIDNYSIDHIKPLSKFDLTNEEQIKRCFNHSNVQVIPLLDNLKKFNKWTEEDEKQWSESIQT